MVVCPTPSTALSSPTPPRPPGPFSINGGAAYTTSSIQTCQLYYGTTGYRTTATGAKIYEGTALTFTHKGVPNGKTCYYRLCAADKAGNVSIGATASAKPKAGGALLFLHLLLRD
jgi:hypothetical protein